MPTNNDVGAKIRGLRELRGVSLDELSERCNMPREQIEKIEAGNAAASLTPLLKIARGLGVRLGTFLDDSNTCGPVLTTSDSLTSSVRFAGNADKNGLEFHPLAANKADRSMEPFIIDVNPLASQDFELSSHEGEEFIYVLGGTIEVAYGKDKFLVHAGDSIYYDSIVPHHLHAYGSDIARILAVVYSPH